MGVTFVVRKGRGHDSKMDCLRDRSGLEAVVLTAGASPQHGEILL